MLNPIRGQFIAQAHIPQVGGAAANSYAAGAPHYGAGRPMPTSGLVTDRLGYAQRDSAAAARRDALIRRGGQL